MKLQHAAPTKHDRTSWSWRVAVSVGLVVGYLALAGDAIRCQYFAPEHDHHSSSPSQTQTHHATHCLIANHGSATIPSIASLGVQPFLFVGHIPYLAPLRGSTVFAASTPARAPPSI